MQAPEASILGELTALGSAIVTSGGACDATPSGTVQPRYTVATGGAPALAPAAQRAPHGDARTYCSLYTLPSIMKVRRRSAFNDCFMPYAAAPPAFPDAVSTHAR